MRTAIMSTALVSSLVLGACASAADNDEPLTRDEAEQAVDSVNLASSAQSLTLDVVEISTHFTIGQGVRKAAAELKLFASTQIPCAAVSVNEQKVTIDFGGLEDACTFQGQNFGGVVELEVERSDANLLVHHTWRGLTNGEVTLNGSADVTWSKDEATRHVSYEMAFSNDAFDTTFAATGDVTQTLLDPALGRLSAIELEGTRSVKRDDGRTWLLDIDGVEVRGLDPVPQAGSYVLTTPNGKYVTMRFERISPTTIRVTVTGPRGRTHTVDVLSLG